MAEKESHSDEVTTEDVEQQALSVRVCCDPCLQDDENINAEGFCVDCNDCLCGICYTSHKKSRASRNHVLKDKTKMPVSKPVKINELEICPEHKFELITHYCKSHDQALCKLCKQIDHRNCTDIQPIDDICCDSEQLKQIKDQLESLQNEFKENVETVRENKANAEKYHLNLVKRVKQFRDKDLEMMSAIENTCKTVGPQITSLMNDIDNCSTTNERLAALLTLKIKSNQNNLRACLTSVKMDNKISRYRFVESNTSEKLSSGIMGEIRKCLFKFQEINLQDFKITDMIKLSEGRLVVTVGNDFPSYGKISLVDMTSETIVLDKYLDIPVHQLTRIDGKSIAVTTDSDKTILIMSVSDKLTIQKKIKTNTDCLGIVYFNSTLIVSGRYPDQIKILKMDGSVKQEIDGTSRFGCDYNRYTCIATNRNTSILYISEYATNKVLSMTLDGQVTACFTHEQMKGPSGLTVSRDGRVFVCSENTNIIFEITSDLSEGQVLLNKEDGISYPHCIIYNDEEESLCIGSSYNFPIQMFFI